MLPKLGSYCQYKETGIRWLGKIPNHWECRTLSKIAEIQISYVDKKSIENEIPIKLCNYLDVYRRNFITPNIRFMEATALPREIKKFGLRKHDVLITKDSESWNDIAVPAYVTHDMPSVLCGYHVALIRPRSDVLLGRYLFRSFQAETLSHQFRLAANGVTRYAISRHDIAKSLFLLPTKSEQHKIANFLNWLDQRFDQLMHTKRRLIELLNEQKQAIISHAVTRGLNPSVRLKPSGIDWLPEMPETWSSVRLRNLASSFKTGPFGSQLHSSDYVTNGTPLINPAQMRDGKIIANPNCSIGPEKAKELAEHRLDVGDIVFARRGKLGRCARVGETESGWFCGTGSIRLRLKEKCPRTEYLVMLLRSKGIAQWLSAQSVGATMENLNPVILGRLSLPLPPTAEQQEIEDHIGQHEKSVGRVIDLIWRQVDLLREYRARLISDVVTGKLDVTGVKFEEGERESNFLQDFEENVAEIDSDEEIDSMEGLDE